MVLCKEIHMMFWYRFGLYAWRIVGSTIKCKLILCWLSRAFRMRIFVKDFTHFDKVSLHFLLKLMFQGYGDCRLKQVACHLLNVFSVMTSSSRFFKVWCPYVRWLWNKKAPGQCVWGPYHVLCLFRYLKQNILKTYWTENKSSLLNSYQETDKLKDLYGQAFTYSHLTSYSPLPSNGFENNVWRWSTSLKFIWIDFSF